MATKDEIMAECTAAKVALNRAKADWVEARATLTAAMIAPAARLEAARKARKDAQARFDKAVAAAKKLRESWDNESDESY